LKFSVAQVGKSVEIAVFTFVMQPVVPLSVAEAMLIVPLVVAVAAAMLFDELDVAVVVVVVLVVPVVDAAAAVSEFVAHETASKLASITRQILLCVVFIAGGSIPLQNRT